MPPQDKNENCTKCRPRTPVSNKLGFHRAGGLEQGFYRGKSEKLQDMKHDAYKQTLQLQQRMKRDYGKHKKHYKHGSRPTHTGIDASLQY